MKQHERNNEANDLNSKIRNILIEEDMDLDEKIKLFRFLIKEYSSREKDDSDEYDSNGDSDCKY